MAPLSQIFTRAAPLTSGFIGRHPAPPNADLGSDAPISPPHQGFDHGHHQPWSQSGHERTEYVLYQGTGALQDGWPDKESWVSFDDMWAMNLPTIKNSCTSAGLAAIENSSGDIDALQKAIQTAASSADVDARFILAVVMQESKGCVRVRTTSSPGAAVRNPGLMQSHNGPGSCSDQTSCPPSAIEQMIRDGAAGTPSGDGLKQCLDDAQGDDAEKVYRAARMYNSGSIAPSGLLGQGVATHCYASDVANRLTGWTDSPTKCFLDDS